VVPSNPRFLFWFSENFPTRWPDLKIALRLSWTASSWSMTSWRAYIKRQVETRKEREFLWLTFSAVTWSTLQTVALFFNKLVIPKR
jgi:hypothetical protein